MHVRRSQQGELVPYNPQIGRRLRRTSMAKEQPSIEEFLHRFLRMEDTLSQHTKIMVMLQGKLSRLRNEKLKIPIGNDASYWK